SGAMMLDYMGWKKASALIRDGIKYTIKEGTVTYDLARQIEGAKKIKCSEFANKIIEKM
ncbi:MAG: NADP-dependent isocitrate dehydrogenase, partial [Proteobacteria bacterium]|nr:NADP-dependent isocitrate dehydrogenase [Pseudomonadota bacterium]